MAGLYADEDFDLQVVIELRRLGHDVLTVQEAGQGNQGTEDADILAFATDQGRALLTFNRRHFINLHRSSGSHHGILVCSRDVDVLALAGRIDRAVQDSAGLRGQLIRVNRPQGP